MEDRLDQELALLRKFYGDVEYRAEGRWIRIGAYVIPSVVPPWNRSSTDITFQVPVGYPATPPYGFYVLVGLQCGSAEPTDYNANPGVQPPFGGRWGFFSWQQDGQWRPTADLVTGTNLLNFARTFADRFRSGR